MFGWFIIEKKDNSCKQIGRFGLKLHNYRRKVWRTDVKAIQKNAKAKIKIAFTFKKIAFAYLLLRLYLFG